MRPGSENEGRVTQPCTHPMEAPGVAWGSHCMVAFTKVLDRYGSWIACCLSRGAQAPLTEGDVASLSHLVEERSFAGGTYVFREGDHAAEVHIVRTGCIELSRDMTGRCVTLQILHPGDVFGDVPAFLGSPAPFDARATEDSTVLAIEAAALSCLLQTRPNVAQRWFVSMAERMAGLQDRLVDLLAGPLEAQLASLLLREADADCAVHITQAHLAKMLGAQRSSVHRVLKSLQAAELIELTYGRIKIVDESGLRFVLDH
jgi:CRP-like cAMP-binding protein